MLLLLEAGFLAIFFGRTRTTEKTIAWLYRWLAFRLYFLSGFVKLASHDPTWRSLSALDFHYWTQPLPTIVAWYADKLPRGFQHASTVHGAGDRARRAVPDFHAAADPLLWRGLAVGPASPDLPQPGTIRSSTCSRRRSRCFYSTIRRCAGSCGRLPNVPASGCCRSRHERDGPAARCGGADAVDSAAGLRADPRERNLAVPEPVEMLARYTSPFQLVNSYGLFAVMTTERLGDRGRRIGRRPTVAGVRIPLQAG